MKLPAEKWRTHGYEQAAFYGYRWFAWGLAALSLMLSGHQPTNLFRDVVLLVLLAVINIIAMALAASYIAIAKRTPLILTLDLAVVTLILWLSGSSLLPFFPYALAALILPALLLGWGGAFVAGVLFACADLSVLWLVDSASALSPNMVSRVLIPVAFALCWAAVGQVLERFGSKDRAASAQPQPSASTGFVLPRSEPLSSPIVRLADMRTREHSGKPQTASLPLTSPLAIAHIASEQRTEPIHPLIYSAKAHPETPLFNVVQQLADEFARQHHMDVQVSALGTARMLSLAHQSVLIRVAQEGLLNVQQHSQRQVARLSIHFEPRAVLLIVQDDGVGLLDGTYERPGLHALRALRYRLAELDGQLAVFESDTGGVTLRATLPLD